MTASTEPRGGLEYGWDPKEDGWGPPMNANLLRLSRVGFHPSVISKSTTAPPGSPVSGEGYIVPSGATGAWSGQSGKIAIWDGAAWAYIAPRDGFLVHVADADGLALYDGGAWSADVLRSDRLATAYAHSQATGNPHSTTAAQIGALAADNPDFAGALKQGGVTRITSGGGAWLASVQATNLVGAGDRPVAADLTGTLQPKTPDQFRSMIFALASSLKGAANGVAELGADGRVPTAQLPSYVDDVVEYANLTAFPATGETGKIYVNLDQNKTWRWSGSAYVEISASLALGETSSTAYRGDRGKTAYDHSQSTGNPHATTPSDIGAAPLAGAEVLIHSDFGRSISDAGWQSTFTDNSAAGLLLPANSVSNGTSIRFEQFFENIHSSTTGVWQLAIGPLLSPGTGPSFPAYFDVVDVRGSIYGAGRLFVDVEFLGAGSEMVAHVSARVFFGAFGTHGDVAQMAHGTIPFDATSARYIDIQAYPAGMGAGPVVRRNRVRRCNP